MPDYAPNYTARYRMRYSVGGANHTSTIRPAGSSDDPAAIAGAGAAIFTDVLTALAPMLSDDFTVLGADVAVANSDIFLPAATVPVGTGSLGTTLDAGWVPMNLSFVGRTTAGGRGLFRIFGPSVNPMASEVTQNDWRLTAAEDARVSDVVNILMLDGARLKGNDGAALIIYPYANVSAHAYWQKRRRRS